MVVRELWFALVPVFAALRKSAGWPIASVPQFGLSLLLAEPDIVTQIDR
jgi:hypothetical protein